MSEYFDELRPFLYSRFQVGLKACLLGSKVNDWIHSTLALLRLNHTCLAWFKKQDPHRADRMKWPGGHALTF